MEATMSIGLMFWFLMVLWLVWGVYTTWPNMVPAGGNLLLWVIIALLGWHAFGPILHG
jgi:hypothetical protein